MMRLALSAASIAAILAVSSVQAQQQEMSCTDEHIAKVNSEAMNVQNAQMREAATKELNTAKEMKTQNKMDDCKTHLQKAMEAMTRTKAD